MSFFSGLIAFGERVVERSTGTASSFGDDAVLLSVRG